MIAKLANHHAMFTCMILLQGLIILIFDSQYKMFSFFDSTKVFCYTAFIFLCIYLWALEIKK